MSEWPLVVAGKAEDKVAAARLAAKGAVGNNRAADKAAAGSRRVVRAAAGRAEVKALGKAAAAKAVAGRVEAQVLDQVKGRREDPPDRYYLERRQDSRISSRRITHISILLICAIHG
jgi:hypothetical protein